MKRRIFRTALPALLLAAGLFVWTAVRIVSFPTTVAGGTYDCAIVLGAAVHGDGPSPVFEGRLEHAVDLYQEGRVRCLILTGGSGAAGELGESVAGRAYALEQGVPEESILIESVSHTTRENLVEAKRVMGEAGIKTAVVVSDPLHLRRAMSMAADLKLDAVPSATPTTRYRSLASKVPFLLREILFSAGYFVCDK